MIFKPAIIALLMGSTLTGILLLISCFHAVRIVRKWDLRSGSEFQLNLEKKTYLISTIVAYSFAFQLVSLFLFIYTADHLHTFFVGAMCAAGTLNANGWGYPVLILKVINFLLAGLWLIVNAADNKGFDYPLIRKKYLLLIALCPLILAEALMQAGFFMDLKPDIITSCCGTVFSGDAAGIAADISILAPKWVMGLFFAVLVCTILLGAVFHFKGKWGYLFASASLCTLFLSMAAMISFISPYFYELPTHHCPFCILQAEYRYIGYPLYIALFGGAICGMGVGLLMPFRGISSLQEALPLLQKKLSLVALVSLGLFLIIVACRMLFSNLVT